MIVIGLPVGAVLIGMFVAFFSRSMFPNGWQFASAFVVGSILSAAMPFGLSIAAAEEARGATESLLPMLGVVAGFVGLVAFVVTMVLSGGGEPEPEEEESLPTLYRKNQRDRR